MLAVIVPAPTITGVTDSHTPPFVLRTGGVTNATTLTISGTVAPGATTGTVTVFNGNASLGSAPISGKTWSITTDVLAEGIYNFRARVTVGATTSPASARPFVVTVDTTAPKAPTISNVLDDKAPFVGTVPRNGITNDQTLTLTGTAEPGSRVEVFANGESLGMATPVGSTWRFTTKPLATDGAYSFTAKATDKAGNTSDGTLLPYSVTLDSAETTPIIGAIYDDVGNARTDVRSATVSNDTALELEGTADAGSTVRVFDGKTLLGAVRADSSGKWTFATRPLTNGQSYRFAAQATDAVGNTSAMSAVSPMLIDTTPPWRPLITGVGDGGRLLGDRGVTNRTPLTVSGRSEPGSKVDVYDGSVLLGSLIDVSPTGEWSLGVSGLAESVHLFRATATDAAGNRSVLPSVTYTVTIDTTAPNAPTIDSAFDTVEPNLGVLQSGDTTNDTRPLFTGTTAELGTIVKIYDGTPSPATFLGLADVTGTTWTFRPTSPFSDASHMLNATATDAAGNESVPFAFTITVDTTPASFSGFGDLPLNGVYELDDELLIEIVFDEEVFVDGKPRLVLNTDPVRYATYESGNGTNTLVFKYVPQLGDTAADLDLASDSIDLNGGTIRDIAGNDVNPALPAPGSPDSFGVQTDIEIAARLTFDPYAVQPPGVVSPTLAGVIPTSTPLPPITITFNAPLTRELTVDSFDLFLENRSMTTEGMLIEKLADDTYRLTLPPSTHQSLKGRYRLDIGGPGSAIESGGVLMDTVVSLYWQLV